MRRVAAWLCVGLGLLAVTLGALGLKTYSQRRAEWRARVDRAMEAGRQCEHNNKKYKNYEQYHAGLRIPYVSPIPQAQWAEKFKALQIGMTENDVERVMGPPDYARCDLSMKGDRFIGSMFEYRVQLKQDLVSYRDNSWIEVFFGSDGKLRNKDAVNIQGIPNRPFPRQGS